MRGSERNEGRKRLARKEVIERREVSMGQSCAAGWEEKQKGRRRNHWAKLKMEEMRGEGMRLWEK